MTFRKLLLWVLPLCTIILTTSCSDKKESTSADAMSDPNAIKAKITMATNRNDFHADGVFDRWVSQFNETYPNIEVTIESFGNFHNTIKTRIAAGQAPDVFLVKPGRFKQSDYPKYFAPLDDLGLKDDIYGAEGGSYDGKLYYIPYGVNKTGLSYSKKAFRSAGIEKAPVTLDEFYLAADKLKSAGITPFSSMIVDTWTGPRVTELLAPLYGEADVYSAMADTDTPLTLESQIGKAVNWTFQMNTKGYMEADPISTNFDTAKAKIANGELGMVAMEQWFLAQILATGVASDDLGFMPIPIDNSGNSYSLVDPDNCYVVSKHSKSVEASKLFVNFLMTDVYPEWIELTGLFSTRKSMSGLLKMDQAVEFNSFNPTLLERMLPSDNVVDIMNEARWNFDNLADEASINDDLQSIFDENNTAWAKARS